MYEAYFGLTERPFSIAPDPHYLYLSERHREALAHLLFGITERGGFVQLTGEVGTGKTTITRALLEQLPADVDVALIINPNVTSREFLAAICAELKIDVSKRGHSTQTLMDDLMRYLLDAYAAGRHTVVLVDEAQNLSPQVLEQVRLLTNLETTKEKLLQIILVGQPELRELLARPELRQVAQRVTARYHLSPLSLAETRRYIQHRCQVAGAGRPLFSEAAIRVIHYRAGGIPRLINVICDRALLGAYATGRSRVTLPVALHAASEVAGRYGNRWPKYARRAALVAAVPLAAAIAVWQWPAPSDSKAAIEQTAPAEPTFAERLAAHGTDPEAAFGPLFQLWGERYQAGTIKSPCEQAIEAKLRCYFEHGDWEALQRRNLPAVIELRDDVGRRHPVLLAEAGGGEAVVVLNGERVRVPIPELIRRWTHDSVTLWRPPSGIGATLGPDSQPAALRWLVAKLDRAEGKPASTTVPAAFDRALERRVREFQQRQGLTVDGIVGEMTLFNLFLAAPDPGAPTLGRK